MARLDDEARSSIPAQRIVESVDRVVKSITEALGQYFGASGPQVAPFKCWHTTNVDKDLALGPREKIIVPSQDFSCSKA